MTSSANRGIHSPKNDTGSLKFTYDTGLLIETRRGIEPPTFASYYYFSKRLPFHYKFTSDALTDLSYLVICGAEGLRSPYLLFAKQALFRLSYSPRFWGSVLFFSYQNQAFLPLANLVASLSLRWWVSHRLYSTTYCDPMGI